MSIWCLGALVASHRFLSLAYPILSTPYTPSPCVTHIIQYYNPNLYINLCKYERWIIIGLES